MSLSGYNQPYVILVHIVLGFSKMKLEVTKSSKLYTQYIIHVIS